MALITILRELGNASVKIMFFFLIARDHTVQNMVDNEHDDVLSFLNSEKIYIGIPDIRWQNQKIKNPIHKLEAYFRLL